MKSVIIHVIYESNFKITKMNTRTGVNSQRITKLDIAYIPLAEPW